VRDLYNWIKHHKIQAGFVVTFVVFPFLPAKWQDSVVRVFGIVGFGTPFVCVLLVLAIVLWSRVRRWFHYPARHEPLKRIDTALRASDIYRALGHLLRLIVGAIGLICFLNTFSFIIANLILGGDAVGGCIENGHYYLSPKLGCHIRVEVSHAVFQYSLWHARSVSVTGPILVIFMVGFALTALFTRVVRRWFPEAHG
jgi:hypothetical protein